MKYRNLFDSSEPRFAIELLVTVASSSGGTIALFAQTT